MLVNSLLVLTLLVIVLLVFVALRPAEFRISRAVRVNASAEQVFDVLNDLRRWDEWSPWSHLDPQMEKTWSPVSIGEGASYQWNGNRQVGAGKQRIVESVRPARIRLLLEFERPFRSRNEVEFVVREEPGQSSVTWTMFGRHNFGGKLFDLIANMDKMVGKDFEKGLANLKQLVERSAA